MFCSSSEGAQHVYCIWPLVRCKIYVAFPNKCHTLKFFEVEDPKKSYHSACCY